eukprot:scaffold3042_cov313-Prasinococcus_capsulatus_cf.AAC.4
MLRNNLVRLSVLAMALGVAMATDDATPAAPTTVSAKLSQADGDSPTCLEDDSYACFKACAKSFDVTTTTPADGDMTLALNSTVTETPEGCTCPTGTATIHSDSDNHHDADGSFGTGDTAIAFVAIPVANSTSVKFEWKGDANCTSTYDVTEGEVLGVEPEDSSSSTMATPSFGVAGMLLVSLVAAGHATVHS